MPGQQADGLLQEGELRVVEAEDLVHHVGLQLHGQAEHGEGLAAACAEQNLPGERVARHQDPHEGPWAAACTAPPWTDRDGVPTGSAHAHEVGRTGVVSCTGSAAAGAPPLGRAQHRVHMLRPRTAATPATSRRAGTCQEDQRERSAAPTPPPTHPLPAGWEVVLEGSGH